MTTSQLQTRGTRATRDKFLDVVRAGAILAVVAQHWTMPVLSFSGNTLATGNALATPGWWIITWASQVMPLVFFAGGAANLISLRRAESTRAWFAGRVRRLLVPVLPLMAVWLVVPDLLRGMGVPPQPVQVASAIAAQLLWFLSVYLLTVLLTPLMVAAHRRWGLAVPAVLAGLGVLVDVARFSDLGMIGYANAVIVWVAVHQLGFHYVEGRLGSLSRRAALTVSAAGFGVTALLVAFGPYPASMIGMPGAPVSNMSPPTVLLLFLALGQIGFLLAFREKLVSLPRVTAALSWLSPRFMSVYLWHMPALVVVSGVTVLGLGYSTPTPGSSMWFLMVPAWIAVCGAVLLGLLRLFERFETQPDGLVVTARTPQLVLAGLLASGGLLGLAAHGFAPLNDNLLTGPLPWVALVAAGYALAGRQVSMTRSRALVAVKR
ncbi:MULTISPECIES: acyltransferase [unclassified Amycolatopsis]|uniref:acyltransferase family protein n=1 Tax=unclassified Amycolatopsis TaxID=2618356 RepID=UPI00106E795B|nr:MULTISPECIES: acyltransferase [unclassified Amycolatopsis]